MRRNCKKQRGVTIIALTITIIVLLILAGISISILTGNNPIIGKSEQSKRENEIMQYQEKLEVLKQLEYTNNYIADKEKFMNNYADVVKNDEMFKNSKEITPDLINLLVKVTTKEGYKFEVTIDDVIYVGDENTDNDINIGNVKVTIQATPTDWTNGTVKVKILSNVTNITKQYSIDGGNNWKKYENEIEIQDNGTEIQARAINSKNEITDVVTKRIENIDRLEPNNFMPTISKTLNSITIQATTTDKEATTKDGKSGIKGYKFSKDNGANYTEIKQDGRYTFENLKLGATYQIKVKAIDNAGNEISTTTKDVTIKEETNEYTLTVNPNGGTWNGTTGISTFTQNPNSTKVIANPTAPAGYKVTFNGNGGNTPTAQTSTKTFINWTNSGAGKLNGTTYTFGTGNGTLTANYKNNSITLPSATREGYTFVGWYDSANGGIKVGDAGTEYAPTEEKTLYAHWTVNQYTLTINPNGGVWPYSATITKNYGETITLEKPIPPRRYTITFNGNGGNTPAEITSTKTFSNWLGTGAGTLIDTTYTFGAGDCTLTAYYSDNSIALPSTTRVGYTFDGWYDSLSGGNKIGNAGAKYTPTNHGTMYARWIDSAIPVTGMLTANPTTWTNGNVTLTGRAQDLGSGISYYQFSTDGNLTNSSPGWISIPNTKNEIVKEHTVTTNGTYYFYVKDASGNINKKSIVVSNIDKVLPTVQVAPTQGKWGKHNYRNVEIPITLSAQDSGGSGLNLLQYAWSTSNTTEPTSGWTQFTNNTTTTISSSAGSWYLWIKVTDRAGNRAANVQKVGPFIVYGWQASSVGEWYYYSEETGEKLKGWQYLWHDVGLQDNKYWYYLQPDKGGMMALGWKFIDGYWYWFVDVVTETTSGGEMKTGWQFIDGKYYYFKEDGDGTNHSGPVGSMEKGWQFINGYWYYLIVNPKAGESEGQMAQGWYQLGNSWYYLKKEGDGIAWEGPTGSMIANREVWIVDKWYKFDANGVCTNP